MNPVHALQSKQIAALQFAVRFAQSEPEEARRVAEQVRDFAFRPEWAERGPRPDARTVVAIRDETRALLDRLARDGVAYVDLNLRLVVTRPNYFGSRKSKDMIASMSADRVRDQFLFRVIQLLEDVGGDRLCVCQAPQAGTDEPCGRLFLKVTRKEFCSEQCRSRAYMRATRRQERAVKKGLRSHGETTRTR